MTSTPDLELFFGRLKEKTTITDANGNLLGVFTPWSQAEAELYAHAKEFFSLEELEQREKEPGRHSTEEVLKHIMSREPAE